MKVNKGLIITLIIGIILAIFVPAVNAVTPNEELYNYFKNTSYTVNGKTYTANAEQLTILERYLNSNTVTSEQVELVKKNAEKVVNILKAEKTVDVTKLPKDSLNELENIVDSTAAELGITEVHYKAATNTVEITYGGRTDSVPLQKSTVQTGHSYVPYIITSVVAIIAVAAIVLKRKVK